MRAPIPSLKKILEKNNEQTIGKKVNSTLVVIMCTPNFSLSPPFPTLPSGHIMLTIATRRAAACFSFKFQAARGIHLSSPFLSSKPAPKVLP